MLSGLSVATQQAVQAVHLTHVQHVGHIVFEPIREHLENLGRVCGAILEGLGCVTVLGVELGRLDLHQLLVGHVGVGDQSPDVGVRDDGVTVTAGAALVGHLALALVVVTTGPLHGGLVICSEVIALIGFGGAHTATRCLLVVNIGVVTIEAHGVAVGVFEQCTQVHVVDVEAVF